MTQASLEQSDKTYFICAKIPLKYYGSLYKIAPRERRLDGNKSYFLTGTSGTLKTGLACEWLKINALKGLQCIYASLPSIFLEMQDGIKYGTCMSILEYYTKMRYLVLDDLGTENSSEWIIAQLYTLISRREADCLPTVITSNLSLKEIMHKVGDRIGSRIRGMCEIIKTDGKDRRFK